MLASILDKISAVVQWFADLFVAVFVALWDILRDVFAWVFDQVLTVAVSGVTSVDVSGLTNNLQGAFVIPQKILEVASAVGLAQALAIIGAAITVRLGLQLIPFTRLGS
jgi:hypothetical protein